MITVIGTKRQTPEVKRIKMSKMSFTTIFFSLATNCSLIIMLRTRRQRKIYKNQNNKSYRAKIYNNSNNNNMANIIPITVK